jgi:hypothetical protein
MLFTKYTNSLNKIKKSLSVVSKKYLGITLKIKKQLQRSKAVEIQKLGSSVILSLDGKAIF